MRPGCGQDVARMWPGCGQDGARMWQGCGQDVARVRSGCGQDMAMMGPGCGQDVTKMWPGCGQDVTKVWPGCCQDVVLFIFKNHTTHMQSNFLAYIFRYRRYADILTIPISPLICNALFQLISRFDKYSPLTFDLIRNDLLG